MNEDDIISGNSFKRIADDFLDEEKTFLDLSKKPKIIFLKTDWIELFKIKILPKIDYQFTLITHNADRSCPSGNLDLLNDIKLKKWYGMNCDIEHPKLQPVPIGIANEKWKHGDKKILINTIKTETKKNYLCYCNFDVSTNFTERTKILNIIKDKKFINHQTNKLQFSEYLETLKEYKYVISPPGNGIDCHRIWESLYLGTIPIVQKHLSLNYFTDLPILFVDSFEEITEKMLNDEDLYDRIKSKNKEKIYFKFFKQQILNND